MYGNGADYEIIAGKKLKIPLAGELNAKKNNFL